MGKKMRLPNGYGSIYKLSGNRRKSYAVAITTGWTNSGKQIQEIIAYVGDRAEGLSILAEYHKNPYDISLKDLTFERIWQETVEKKIIELVSQEKMSASNLKGLRSVYNNHCVALHNRKIMEIKIKEMQIIIDSCNKGYTTRGYIKTLCIKIFESALIDYEMPLQSNPAKKLKIGEKEKSTLHKIIAKNDRDILWNNKDDTLVKIILIYIYSGLRPSELINIKRENVFLEENYMIGGSKTDAGKNRVIPIHKKIKNFVEQFYNQNNEYLIALEGVPMNYDKYKVLFKRTMSKLNLDYIPHDTRHTFSTMMKEAGANEYILKIIMGHSIEDLTEKTYTHRDINTIINEIDIIE